MQLSELFFDFGDPRLDRAQSLSVLLDGVYEHVCPHDIGLHGSLRLACIILMPFEECFLLVVRLHIDLRLVDVRLLVKKSLLHHRLFAFELLKLIVCILILLLDSFELLRDGLDLRIGDLFDHMLTHHSFLHFATTAHDSGRFDELALKCDDATSHILAKGYLAGILDVLNDESILNSFVESVAVLIFRLDQIHEPLSTGNRLEVLLPRLLLVQDEAGCAADLMFSEIIQNGLGVSSLVDEDIVERAESCRRDSDVILCIDHA